MQEHQENTNKLLQGKNIQIMQNNRRKEYQKEIKESYDQAI
jgi:hypothetical protein